MKIELRNRMLASGNKALYLEFYEKGGKRSYESLNLFLIPEKSEDDRRVNEATLKKAVKMKAERVLGIERKPEPKQLKVPKRKLAEWLDEHLQQMTASGIYSNGYILNTGKAIAILKSYLEYVKRPNMLMSSMSKAIYKDFLVYLKDVYRNTKSPNNPKPLSPKTMLLVQTTLNTMFKSAVREGVMFKNPFYELDERDTIAKTPSEREFLTVEELKRMAVVETGSPRSKQTFMFCCFTGLRHSDMCNLRWEDIRETDAGQQIYVRAMQKTGKPCMVPLGAQAKEWLPERGDAAPDSRVFTDAPSICRANRALKHMAKRAGIKKNISFHCSRHTFATLILTAGSDIYTASRLLGHSNIHTTEIYANVVMEKKVDAVNLLNCII